MGNSISVPPTSSPTLSATIGVVKIVRSSGLTYGTSGEIWTNAEIVSITKQVGPDPGTAIVEIPVASLENSVGKTSTSKVHGVGFYPKEITRIKAPEFSDSVNSLFSKVFIFAGVKEVNDLNLGTPIFVGYIISYRWVGSKESTTMRIHLEDARHFWKKAPVQGTLFRNINAGTSETTETVYIRAHDPVFNMGQHPNRHVLQNGFNDDIGFPQFVNINLNRFRDEPGTERNRQFIPEDAVEAAFNAGQIGGQAAGEPHARIWLPFHVWNYLTNMFMGGFLIADRPTDADLGHDKSEDDFPVNLAQVMLIKPIHIKGLDAEMWQDWKEPRAEVGGLGQTGTTQLVSGIGEFAPAGIPAGDVFFELCRRVGNFTIAVTYDNDGILHIHPIRTTLAHLMDQNAGVGLRSGSGIAGGGKANNLVMPSSKRSAKDIRPEIESWDIENSGSNYYNRFFMKGGKRWIQLTFSTVGTGDWTDHHGIVHRGYDPPGDKDWIPQVPEGTIAPGWSPFEQTEWLKIFADETDLEQYPDVFSTWVVRDNIPWIDVYNQAAATVGYRLFFTRDRMIQNELLTRIFESTLSAFRSRPRKLPIQIWRAYQGIPIDGDNNTPYGDDTTLDEPIEFERRWQKLQADATMLTDGRLGFKLNSEGRRNFKFSLEDADKINGTTTPWSWNGLDGDLVSGDPRAYEMAWTVAVEVDEDLYEYRALIDSADGGMPISEFGPPMELHRDAGNEYGEERVHNSMIDNPFGAGDIFQFRVRVPEPSLEGKATTLYRNGQEEISAKNQIQVNRHAMADIEGNVVLDHIALDLEAGQYMRQLTIPDDTDIPIGALISSLHHDFIEQKTTVRLSTIR